MTDHTFMKSPSGVVSRLVMAGWMAVSVASALAQAGPSVPPKSASPGDAAYVPTMTFDVASVRQNTSVDASTGVSMGGQFGGHTATIRLINWDIRNLIGYAYGVDGFQLTNLPKWPWPTVFVIEAKGDSQADAKMMSLPRDQQVAEQQHMLQALLEDRFKLKTHWETKEGDTYKLVVAKGGPKLGAAGSIPPSANDLKAFGDRPIPVLRQRNDQHGYDFVASSCSMGQMVQMLSGQFGRPVIDQTGLTGNYDFVLAYKGRWDRDRDADDLDPMPPMERALQEQLGLRIEPAKGPIKFLVIDHVEKPSDN